MYIYCPVSSSFKENCILMSLACDEVRNEAPKGVAQRTKKLEKIGLQHRKNIFFVKDMLG